MKDRYKNRKACFHAGKLLYSEALDDSNNKVFIQEVESDFPTIDDLVSLKNDFEITHSVSIPGALKSIELVRSGSAIAVAKEYFDGIPLSQFIKNRKLSLNEALTISIGITEIVKEVHKRLIIHKDINPSSFLINPDTLEVRLCRFGIATSLTREQADLSAVDSVKGSLFYIAPEQTGRMNRSVDYRADFYSLGVTIYQLLCHQLPFSYTNTMELIHAHMAKQPEDCSKINPEVPAYLSDIVKRLMAKNAEDRYQSASGLLEDLLLCRKLLEQPEEVGRFVVGENDVNTVFRISEKLYGREQEIRFLEEAYDEAGREKISMVLVAGYAGVGKTRLIHEIHKPIARGNGYFASGKFDQYNRNNPYSAIGAAFGSLLRQFLAQNPAELEAWKKKIKDALDDNGQVLIDVIPELEILLGKQPPVLKLGLNETQARFVSLFRNFVRVLASTEHPLVVFIDDLQWADSGSLELLFTLLSGGDIRNILIIGAYRDNEVSTSHPLMLLHERLEKTGRPVPILKLSELSIEDVNHLIADSFHRKIADTLELTELVMNKTRGNPFFVNKFIQKLVQEQLVYFDYGRSAWEWNTEGISTMNITDNVVDLLISKIRMLSPDTQQILQLAACIGNSFDLHTLATISEKAEEEVISLLWLAVKEDLLTPLSYRSKHYNDLIWKQLGVSMDTGQKNVFRFQHDKIQQAAYSLIPEEKRNETHLQIGRLLLEKYSNAELRENVFDIVVHFNNALNLITDKEELGKIGALNYMAGKRAKESNSYQPATDYFQKGMESLERAGNVTLYNDLLIERSECEYLCGRYEASEQIFNLAVANCSSKLEKAEVLARKMQLYENTSRHTEAIRTALEGLHLLGIRLPEHPGKLSIMKELLKVKFHLRGKSIDEIKRQETMNSPELIQAMKIFMNLWGPAYLHNQNLLVLSILRMVNLSLKFGNAPQSALAYTFYGFICCAQLKDIKGGYEFGKLGIWLNEKFNDRLLRSKVYVIFGGCIAHWKDDFSSTLDLLQTAYEVGVESNDLIYAGYALNFLSKNEYLMGESLDSVYSRFIIFIHFGRKVHHLTTLYHLLVEARMVCQLMGIEADPDVFMEVSDMKAHEEKMVEFAEKEGVWLPIIAHHIHQAEFCCLFYEYEKAYEHLQIAELHISSHLGLAEEARVNFTLSLTLLSLAGKNKLQADAYLKRVKKNQVVLHRWAVNAENNFNVKYLLIEAELKAIENKFEEAINTFDLAKSAAIKSNIIQDIALVSERTAMFYKAHGFQQLYLVLLREALVSYSQWRADAKVEQLRKLLLESGSKELVHSNALVEKTEGFNLSSSLDLQSIFKAATTISGEVVFERLLEKLLKITMENAGAQTGFIIRVKNDRLFAAAEGNIENASVELLNDLPVGQVSNLPQSVIQFVFHTSEPLVLNNPSEDPRFSRDAYLAARQPKSILCIPIISQGNRTALLYLENNLSTDVFTQERFEVLKLLSGQIAVSMQNALLYDEQLKLNQAYQRFVPKDFLNALGHQSILEVKLGDNIAQDMTVMFCDIRSYSLLSEKMSPNENFEFINDYLNKVGPLIRKNNGFINHYLGDGLIALFKNSASDAIQAAVEMQMEMRNFSVSGNGSGKIPISIGIGIHSGRVMMGIIGDVERHDANVLSDAVNIAARLEGLTKILGVNIIVSDEVIGGLNDHDKTYTRYLGKIKVVGKENALDVYEIFEAEEDERKSRKLYSLNAYNNALKDYFNKKFTEAAIGLKKVSNELPGDRTVDRYLENAARFLIQGVPENWDGVEEMLQK